MIDYASAVNASPCGIVITDATQPDEPIIFANPAFAELTGYSADEILGRNCRFLQGPGTDPEIAAEIRWAIAQGVAVRKEILNYRKDGTPFWNDLSISPVRGRSGEITSFVGVQTDITARKQAQAARGEAEDQISRIVANMPGYVFRLIRKADGSMLLNGAPLNFDNLSPTQGPIPGAPEKARSIHPDDWEMVRRAIIHSTGALAPMKVEFRMLGSEGEQRWYRSHSTPHLGPNGDIIWDGVGIDVTRAKESEDRLSRIVENLPGFVYQRMRRPDGTAQLTYVSASFARLIGRDPGSLPRSFDIFAHMHPDDRERVQLVANDSATNFSQLVTEYRLLAENGEERWIRNYSTSHDDGNGFVVGDGMGIDITKEKASERRLEAILDNMPGYVFQRVLKKDGAIEFPYVSPSFDSMIGQIVEDRSRGFNLLHYIHPEDAAKLRQDIERSAADMSRLVVEYRLEPVGGQARWIRAYSTPRRVADDIVWDCVAVDITAEKASENRLAYFAYHDPLTGLANRALLTERLAAAIKTTRETGGEVCLSQLLIVDFAEINETLGMDDGDIVLKSVAARMSELSLLDGATVVARIGTAEIAILRHGEEVAAKSTEFAEILMRNVGQPILIGKDSVAIEPSIGISTLCRGDLGHLSADAAAAEMLKRAAIAVSAAARAGRGAHRLYDDELDHRTRHRMILRHSMRQAIDQDQFELHYQPLVDLVTGRIVGAEALIRWKHPELGLVRPDYFIGLAEESGMIGLLGEWVIRRVMRQYKEWEAGGLSVPKIAINVSGVQIGMPDFIDTVRRAIADIGGDPRRFELELTEGFLLERSPRTLRVLEELKWLGFELAIDDFGAGHSNFQYLRNFPVDKLKIDQIFVRQLVADSNDALIIRAIASLARSLKLGLVAEGIETKEQSEFLRDQGCPIGQGYFFSLPLAAEDFAWMIENQVALPIGKPHSKTRADRGI